MNKWYISICKNLLDVFTTISIVTLQFSAVAWAEETPKNNSKKAEISAVIEEIDFSQDIGPNHKPESEAEEKLWEEADEYEAKFLEESSKIIKDAKLNAYVKGVLCKVIGVERCAPIRLYLVRTTRFNALMAPNGMMQIWSGLLIRMDNEAQLAAILAHEYAHYVRRHSLQTAQLAQNLEWTTSVPYVGVLASIGSVGSLFAFNREMESEADRLSLNYIYEAGYDPNAASETWQQLLDEFEVTRPEEKKSNNIFDTFFSTHPSSENRMETLRNLASNKVENTPYVSKRDEYLAALGDWWSKWINDQVAAKDFKTGEYLLDNLAKDGWNSDLHFAKAELYRKRGDKGDFLLAADEYQKSIDAGSIKAEAWRGLGLSLMRSNNRSRGKVALIEYLRRLPDAPDKRMIKMITGISSSTKPSSDNQTDSSSIDNETSE